MARTKFCVVGRLPRREYALGGKGQHRRGTRGLEVPIHSGKEGNDEGGIDGNTSGRKVRSIQTSVGV